MLALSSTLLWMALVSSLAAAAAYALHGVALSVAPARLSAQTAAGPVTVASTNGRNARLPARVATSLVGATLLFLGGSIAARWTQTGHIPLSNMYEATVALAFSTALAYAVFEQATRQRRLGVMVTPLVAVFAAIALLFPSEVTPLIPALQNEPLLTIHVAAMILSYGVLTVAFAGAAVYLVQGTGEERRFRWLPRADRAGDLAHRAVLVGFPMLGIGIALGAWWANSAWGRYWGWDPKETSALLVWLSLAAYFHARAGTGTVAGAPGIRRIVPRRLREARRPDPMWWVVGMYGLLLFTYFGVNLWITGLHSYAGV